MGDLYEQNGVYYKKFTEVPFTGDVTGKDQGRLENGLKEGFWSYFYASGPLQKKGEYKNGLREGSWVAYCEDGVLHYKGDYRNDLKEGYWVEGQFKPNDCGPHTGFLPTLFWDVAFGGEIADEMDTCLRDFGIRLRGYYKDGKSEGLWDYVCLNKDGTEGRLLVRSKERSVDFDFKRLFK